MNVSYVDERGANKSWKLISFSNPKVFDTIKNANVNDVFEITTRKNDKDFTEWASATKVDGAPRSAASSSVGQTKTPVVSQYETRDERNARQRLIVRQSCLSNAIALLKGSTEDAPTSIEDAIGVADKFVAWVFEAPGLYETEEDVLQ